MAIQSHEVSNNCKVPNHQNLRYLKYDDMLYALIRLFTRELIYWARSVYATHACLLKWGWMKCKTDSQVSTFSSYS